MTLTVLKSEDILFKGKNGENLVGLKFLDLNKIANIEGVSEYSVLQLEKNGKTYLMTEEFSVEATLDALDEFVEEYDEEDEEETDYDKEEEPENFIEDKILEETLKDEFKIETVRNKEEKFFLEEESTNKNLQEEVQEELKNSFDTTHLFYKNIQSTLGLDSVKSSNIDPTERVIDTPTDEVLISNTNESEEDNNDTIQESGINEASAMRQTVIKNSIEQNNLDKALSNMGEEALIEGDLTLLNITNLTDNSENIARINNVLLDTTIDEGKDTLQLQNIANILVKLGNTDLTQSEFTLLGLDNLSSEDVSDLNMAINDGESLALGENPNTNLQLILESLNRFDEGVDVGLIDLSNIGVTGVGEVDEPTLEEVNSAIGSEDNTNDIQVIVDGLQATNDSTYRLESENLMVGDLTTLGIIGLTDNTINTARINNILLDSDVTIGNDTTELQALVDVLIKIDEKDGDSSAENITLSEWQLIGLNYVSSPDSNELNIALGNANSLDLGTTPQTNLQLIGDSLNALDQVKYGNSAGGGVTLTDLTNIGVVGVNGGGDEPTLEAVNSVLFDSDVSADHTNSVQDVVDALFILNESDGDSTVEINVSVLETLGITATLGFSNDELDYINNRISENDRVVDGGDGSYRNDVDELQGLVDLVDERSIYMGRIGNEDIPYNVDKLHDGLDGVDTLLVDGGLTVNLSEVQNIEAIVLNNNDTILDTTLGTSFDEISVADVIDVTDEFNVLFIEENGLNGTERIYLDTNEFTFYSTSGGYNFFTGDGGAVVLAIDENIIIE